MKSHLLIATASALMFGAVSCKKEKAGEEHNENELITTVELLIRADGAASGTVYTWRDVDGAGGQEPEVDEITLTANRNYNVQVAFLDESQATPLSLTSEIAEESDAHRIYFVPSAGVGITASGFDTDDNNLPLGLNTTWASGNVTTGSLRVILRHYPNGGKEESDPVNSSKSTTDADVEFPVKVVAP